MDETGEQNVWVAARAARSVLLEMFWEQHYFAVLASTFRIALEEYVRSRMESNLKRSSLNACLVLARLHTRLVRNRLYALS